MSRLPTLDEGVSIPLDSIRANKIRSGLTILGVSIGVGVVMMMAAMVTLDVPLFTEKRQDKRVAATEEKMLAVRLTRDDKLRQLKRLYESSSVKLKGLTERHKRYHNDLLKSAKNNSSAALKAYQSGVTEFTSLMRAHITELDIRLSDLRVGVDRSLAIAQLLYVTGEK